MMVHLLKGIIQAVVNDVLWELYLQRNDKSASSNLYFAFMLYALNFSIHGIDLRTGCVMSVCLCVRAVL